MRFRKKTDAFRALWFAGGKEEAGGEDSHIHVTRCFMFKLVYIRALRLSLQQSDLHNILRATTWMFGLLDM